MAPSLLQTLLRQPSQSYSSRTSPSPSLYDVSLHSSSQSRRTSSLRSSGSRDSARSSSGGDWSNGQWEWAQYGGRAGLTKGPSSIHPSEVASALGVPGETRRSSSMQSSSRRGASRSASGTMDEDTCSMRSQRSSKSLSSVRSSASRSQLPPTWTSPADASLRTNPGPSSQSSGTSRRYSSTDAAPSRRYSSLSPTPSTSSSASTRRTSPSSDAPSLASSISSVPSSPPITPIQSSPLPLQFAPLEPPQPKRKKKQRAPREVVDIAQQHEDGGLEIVQEATEEEERRRSLHEPLEPVTTMSEEAIEHGARTADRVRDEALVSSQTMGVLDKFAAPEPTLSDPSVRKARQYYSVDEFFALATGSTEVPLAFPSPPSPTSSSLAAASEPETEKTTVLNDSIERSVSPAGHLASTVSSQNVPRICLTRTESDQSAAGIKGDVEVPSDEEEQGSSTPSSSSITRKRSKRRSTTSDVPASTQPPTTIQVVASSSPIRSRSASPRSLELAPSIPSTLNTPSSAADPAWLTRIRAFGEPIEPLIQMPPPRSSKNGRSPTPEPHWTVQRYEEQQKELREKERQRQRDQPVRRPSSLGNLRRPRNVMEPMPEMDEGEVEVEPKVQEDEMTSVMAVVEKSVPAPAQVRRSASMSAGSPSMAAARKSDSRASMREIGSAGRPRSPAPAPAPALAIDEERAPRRRTQSAIEPSPYYPPPTIAPHSGPISSSSSRSSSLPPASQPLTRQALSVVSGSPRSLEDDEEEDNPSLYSQSQASTSRYSTMSVPTGAFSRPPKNPARSRAAHRLSAPSMPLDAAAMIFHHGASSPAPVKSNPNLMFTLSISASALARPSQGGTSSSSSFNPFKRSPGASSMEPPLSSSQTHSRRFSPLRDLTYSALAPLLSANKLKSDEVLVEVIAVGLEGVDLVKTREMAGVREGFGWVPGRAVLGRVRDMGEAVEGKGTVRKGEMVWGVAGLKKSSALSELVTIPRDRLSLAPSPTDRLSIEEIAALPSAGACAMQVMEPICRELPRGSKILILSAHRSVGYLCLQLASHLRPQRDLYVVAHCPSTMEADAQLCRDAGASSVLVDEPLAVLNGCHESEFDVVVDCVGGRRIYDASRRVLHHSGAFISTVSPLVVPSSTAAAPESSWKASLRSLRRTFVKKDRKLLSVLSITSETIETRGESPREVLDRVREAVEKGELRARVDKIWRFEESARAFAEGEGESVVRVKEV